MQSYNTIRSLHLIQLKVQMCFREGVKSFTIQFCSVFEWYYVSGLCTVFS